MEPIINPWWIYFASKSEGISIFLLVVCIIIIGVSVFLRFMTWEFDEEDQIKAPKWLMILCTIGIIIGGILPSEKTIYTMMVINQVTPNNIKIVGDTAEDLVDYIFDKVEEITEDEDK